MMVSVLLVVVVANKPHVYIHIINQTGTITNVRAIQAHYPSCHYLNSKEVK